MIRRVLFLYGPQDGHAETRAGDPIGVATVGEHYHLHHVRRARDSGETTWVYRWVPPRTGLRQACRAGDERGCSGGRCPSGRRQTGWARG